MSEPEKPGILDRLRARFGWFDHAMRANERFNNSKGNFFAAGLTYYTIFALFPLLMIGFSVAGFLLARRPDLLSEIDHRISTAIPGDLGRQVVDATHAAIRSRASVGVIGLGAAGWAGLNWMAHLREALSEMWDQGAESLGFLRTKLSDLAALVYAFMATVVTIALTAFSDAAPMSTVLAWLGIHDLPALGGILRGVSLMMSVAVAWVLFTWMIARLPREPVSFACSVRGGLMAAIGFEVFKQVGSIYLRAVLRSPAGATFGPVLGLMVFAYITARLVLFATAWAATSADSSRAAPVQPPDPAVITPRVQLDEGLSARQALAAVAVGAAGALGLSRLARRRRD